MELLAMLPTIILIGGALYLFHLILTRIILIRRLKCKVCLYSFRTPLGKVKVTCPYCQAQYIIRKDKTVQGP